MLVDRKFTKGFYTDDASNHVTRTDRLYVTKNDNVRAMVYYSIPMNKGDVLEVEVDAFGTNDNGVIVIESTNEADSVVGTFKQHCLQLVKYEFWYRYKIIYQRAETDENAYIRVGFGMRANDKGSCEFKNPSINVVKRQGSQPEVIVCGTLIHRADNWWELDTNFPSYGINYLEASTDANMVTVHTDFQWSTSSCPIVLVTPNGQDCANRLPVVFYNNDGRFAIGFSDWTTVPADITNRRLAVNFVAIK